MKEFLSDRVNNMALSATLAMAAKARELKAQAILPFQHPKILGLQV